MELGYASVGRMLAEMSWPELLEWQAFFRLRDKDRKRSKKPPRPDASPAKIMGALMGFQNRRDLNRRPR